MTAERLSRGRLAEQLAAEFLETRGMRVLHRNWRAPGGELDLVAHEGGVCVFVEVRSRTGDERGHPFETVGAAKRAQIIRAARLFLDNQRVDAPGGFRFDVVGVTFSRDDGSPAIEHVADAFRVDG